MAKISPIAILPPVLFLGLAALFYFNLGREDARNLPSTMVGREAPALLNIVDLREDPAPTAEDLRAPGYKLVNFWASWCVSCRAEAAVLEKMKEDGITIIGIDYKDTPDKAFAFLEQYGDPYAQIGADPTGRTGLEWGVYGVPETFVIDGTGKVLMRHPGPIDEHVLEEKILPLLNGKDPAPAH